MTLPFAATSPSRLPLRALPPRLQRSEGTARIAFKCVGGAARLDRLHQSGCAKARFPNVAAPGPPEAVLINTAGGLTGGDRLSSEIALAPGCRAVATTQACEKIYRASSGEARIETRLILGEGARLDWLPQEAILFNGARLARRLEADLAAGSELLLAEAVVFGRTARGEKLGSGLFADRWRIRRAGRLVFAEDLRFDWTGGDPLARPAILAGGAALATILLLSDEPDRHIGKLRAIVGEAGGVSAWNGKLLARIVAADGAALRAVLIPALAVLREGARLPVAWRI